MTKKEIILILIIIFGCIMMLSSCAHTQDIQKCVQGYPANFFEGLWDGLIALFAFVASLFDSHTTIYEVNNTGIGYNLGFLIGMYGFYSLNRRKSS